MIGTRGINAISNLEVKQDEVKATFRDEEIFKIQNEYITNCTNINAELILEIREQGPPQNHNLVEVRFFSHNPVEEDFVQQKKEEIIQNIDTLEKTDDLICHLPELPFIVPRGKYSADIFKKHIKLHGSSYNYSISYENIKKAFLLPLPDQENILFVLNFEIPLRQGQTIYNYAIINFKVDMEIAIKLKLEENLLKEINEKLTQEMEGKYYDVFSKVFNYISNISIIIPGNFNSSKGNNSLVCQIGARQGNLFILNNSVMFLPKPIIHIPYKELLKVNFYRMEDSLTNRNIDMELINKYGEKKMFQGIDKSDGPLLLEYFKQKEIKIEIVKEEQNDLEDDYEDELEENSAENDSKNEYRGKFIKDDDDEDEDDDEDFNPTAIKKSSGDLEEEED